MRRGGFTTITPIHHHEPTQERSPTSFMSRITASTSPQRRLMVATRSFTVASSQALASSSCSARVCPVFLSAAGERTRRAWCSCWSQCGM